MIKTIIPCYNRPEFLAVGLPLLVEQAQGKNISIRFSLDYGYDRHYHEIIRTGMARTGITYDIHYVPQTRYGVGKQSYHLISQYLAGARIPSCELVIMLEEDVFVTNGFFEWHQTAHNKHTLFCAISSRNNNRVGELPKEDYLASGEYQGLGVSFRPAIILRHILPHANDAYFSSPIRYCQERFPKTNIQPQFAEQDGLISRIQITSSIPMLFAGNPNAFHVGFYGKSRNWNIRLSQPYSERLKMVQRVCFDQDLLDIASDGAKDCIACPLA